MSDLKSALIHALNHGFEQEFISALADLCECVTDGSDDTLAEAIDLNAAVRRMILDYEIHLEIAAADKIEADQAYLEWMQQQRNEARGYGGFAAP